MKKIIKKTGLVFLLVCCLEVLVPATSNACGHEGFYIGGGYQQLFQFSPDRQLVGGGAVSPGKIDWRTRWGFYGKAGYDFCESRWGVELPVSYNRQKLNRAETVSVIGVDLNAIFHIIETPGGLDFYWIGGSGMNIVTDGQVKNNSGSGGVNINFGPGLQYFISKKPKVAMGISVPFKYTLYFGDHLSKNITQVFGIPIMAGATIGF
ncbi:MAG: hypothetical protein Q7T03_09235 [Deltaproteobacteria bacterium]|nr:hypothetical protein [Deltaproteobacteria bacterium]